MSRKDYIQLANELGIDLRRLLLGGQDVTGFWIAVATVCDAMKRNNPRFDRDRFIGAIEKEATK